MKAYQKFAQHKHTLRQRFIALGFAGVLFLLIIPYLLSVSCPKLDQRLHFPNFSAGAATTIPGIVVMAAGFMLAWWSMYAQMTIGSGTPLPMLPTQKLVVKPPFTYCRNPMTLGTFFAYEGISIWVGSISAVLSIILFVALLLLYVKFIEEKELALRFGPEYLEYKKNTPFLLPRLRKTRPGGGG